MKNKIMIVDDDPNLRLLYQKELAADEYDIISADDAESALQLLKKENCRVVVLDIEMPEISGLELVTKIKKDQPNTKVILNSAYPMYKADFKSWLADDYLVKSSDLNPLREKIKQLMDK